MVYAYVNFSDNLLSVNEAAVNDFWNGWVASYSNSLVQVSFTNGMTANYFGNFYADSSGNLAGSVTQLDAYLSGAVLYGSVQNMNVDVTTFYSLAVADRIGYVLRSDDTIIGSSYNDSLGGHAGNDYVNGGAGHDVIFGGGGIYSPVDGHDFLVGGYGADFIYGNGGNDLIYTGVDSIGAGDLANIAAGGKGADTIYAADSGETLFGGGSGYDPLDQGDIIYAGSGNDEIYGNGGEDYLFGMEGSDTLYGGYGNDVFIGGLGDDVMIGGAGDEVYWISAANGQDFIGDFNSGDVIMLTGTGMSTFAELSSHFEAWQYGTIINLGSTVIWMAGVSTASLTANDIHLI